MEIFQNSFLWTLLLVRFERKRRERPVNRDISSETHSLGHHQRLAHTKHSVTFTRRVLRPIRTRAVFTFLITRIHTCTLIVVRTCGSSMLCVYQEGRCEVKNIVTPVLQSKHICTHVTDMFYVLWKTVGTEMIFNKIIKTGQRPVT